MNCEQVKGLLSAHLDDALAPEVHRSVTVHIQTCSQCSTLFAELRRNDFLLSQLPRMAPSPALRDRIFSSSEYLELTGTFGANTIATVSYSQQQRRSRRDTPGRPQLVALPGGRSRDASAFPAESALQPTKLQPAIHRSRRGASWVLRTMYIAIAAAILLTIGVGSYISWNLMQPAKQATTKTIQPPADGPQIHGPLSAGIHLLFLRDGTLMSAPADGSTASVPLTPKSVTVSANWAVSSPLPGHSAGDKLAYIDLQKAAAYIIRSDGQGNTIIPQPLLKASVQPSSVWDTNVGAAILNSLAWSPDSSMLAFVADPTNSGLTSLYLYSPGSDSVQMVPLPFKGSVSHPIWSPDSVRVAFLLTHNGVTSILDYNTQNHGLLTITNGTNQSGNLNDTILSFDWSLDSDAPAITWSVGVPGHIHSIWLHRVAVSSNTASRLIAAGDYAQAVYSRTGHGVGSWLLVGSPTATGTTDLWRADITSFSPVALTTGNQISLVQWSPNGMQVDYLDTISSGLGTLHVVNVATGSETLIATGVAGEPAPAWSFNSQELAYSTGMQTVIANVQFGQKPLVLKLHAPASTFVWSATSPNQLVVALGDGQAGIFLVDTQHNTSTQVDNKDTNGPIVWSQVP